MTHFTHNFHLSLSSVLMDPASLPVRRPALLHFRRRLVFRGSGVASSMQLGLGWWVFALSSIFHFCHHFFFTFCHHFSLFACEWPCV